MVLDERASFGQEQFWLAEQLAPATPVHNSLAAWGVHGQLDVAALRHAVDHLVQRHEALRTTLVHTEAGLRQRTVPPRPVEWEVVEAESVAAAEELLRPHVLRPFDLSRDLMLRAFLARITQDEHLLILCVHHSAHDGITSGVLFEELLAIYADGPASLPPPVTQYRTYAERERHLWDDGGRELAAAWLDSLPPLASIVGALPVKRRGRYVTPARVSRIDLPVSTTDRLAAIAADSAATVNMALTSVFAILLSRWTGSCDVVFSTPVSTRFDHDFERTVGFLANALPMHLDVGGNPSFTDLLSRVRSAVLSTMEHAQTPADAIAARLAREAIPRLSFAVEAAPQPWRAAGRVEFRRQWAHPGYTTFDLSLRVELGETAQLVVESAISVDETLVDRLTAHFIELLAVAEPWRKVAEFPSAPASDLDALRLCGTGPQAVAAPGILDRLRTHVLASPDAVAVRDSTTTLTYQQVWDRAGATAVALSHLGLRPQGLAAVSAPRSAEVLVALVAIMRVGAAFAPLDHRDPAARRDLMLASSRADILLTTGESSSWAGPVYLLDGSSRDDQVWYDPPVHPESLAYVIHTSGSTGAPKGVMITHQGLANYLSWATGQYGLTRESTVPLHTSIAFDMAITSLLGPLYAGGCVAVIPDGLGPLGVNAGPSGAFQMIKATPSHLAGVIQDLIIRGRPAPAVIVAGGENWPAGHLREWKDSLPATMFVNEYGPTETVVGSAAWFATEVTGSSTVPIGHPIDGTTIHIVDENLNPVPIGVRGELLIGGAGVARGYRQAPGLTAARFIPDPFGTKASRLYRTGDLAFWNSRGLAELVGRQDDQIKILGYRAEPAEIEAALHACPGVGRAAVLADRDDGQVRRLVAFVTLTDPGTSGMAIRRWLSGRLPAHMVPETVVVQQELPLNGNGKVDRQRLTIPPRVTVARHPLPGVHTWHRLVHDAWSETLDRTDISFDVSFFEAGGTSLMLLRLASALQARGAGPTTVTDLFRYPTIHSLAQHLSGSMPAPVPAQPDLRERRQQRRARRRYSQDAES